MDWTYMARALFTLLCFVSFLLITLVAYRASSKQRYDEVANTIMMDEDTPQHDGDEGAPSCGAKNNE